MPALALLEDDMIAAVPAMDLWGALSSDQETALDWGDDDLGVRYTLAKPGDETDPESDDGAETLSPRVLGWDDDVECSGVASEEDCGKLVVPHRLPPLYIAAMHL